ncbi:hypothetical protein MGYG_06385 [Nannizzia gypsea CBS 118893]|uniref:Cytochrome P450 n=1 Tax=Arthroderma gypseum (strain ATCC MYA-4604 / CBS 118893) TaxID=535722 RepID=E4UZ56_ARTGP|nr:hypothetical protein MGYG_06385 [Nannizzia gypsea CBS 118893]EFR03386.1 hypothetical protein MGYG_06385 [Nannizzia gypsea CBS 118893]
MSLHPNPNTSFFRKRLLFNARLPERGAAFSFYCWGRRHVVLTTPSMVRSLFKQRQSTSAEPCINYLLDNNFGSNSRARKPGREGTYHGEAAKWAKLLTDEPYLTDLSSLLVKEIERTAPSLVSFTSSVVDQCQWERTAGVTLQNEDGEERICITKLYSLISGFVGSTSINLLMGKTLLDVYPNILPDISILNSKFNAMLLGIQRWIPFPGLVNAYLARRRLLVCLTVQNAVFSQIENGQEPEAVWRDLDDISAAVQARMRMRIRNGYSAEYAAAEDLSLLWAVTARAGALVFWNLVHILADPKLHAEILHEIGPYAILKRSSPGESSFGLPEPPRVSLDIDRLIGSCPLLMATQKETSRLYSTPYTYRKVTSDINLTESDEDASFNSRVALGYHLSEGDFVVIPHSLRNRDPLYNKSPDSFDPRRHLTEISQADELEEKEDSQSAVDEDIQDCPAGWDDPVSIWWKLEQKKIIGTLAAILVTWDIKPTKGDNWQVPNRRGGSLIDEPRDLQVMLKMKA